MNKFLKRFFLIIGIILVLVVAAAALITSLFEGKIGKTLISTINEQITSELRVSDFDLTLLSTFPNASANLRGVVLEDSKGEQLLQAENLSFRLGLFGLIRSKIDVKSVVLSNGNLNLSVDRNGKANYDIAKPAPEGSQSDESSNSSGPDISLASAKLENMDLKYVDATTGQDFGLLVTDATFSGEFNSDQYLLKSNALLLTRYFQMDDQRYVSNRNINYDAKIMVDRKEGIYNFDNVKVEVETNVFKVDGSIETEEKGMYYDLFFSCEKGSLASILKLLPRDYEDQIGGIKSSGKFIFTGELKGEATKNKNPGMKVELSLENGKISSPMMNESLRDVSFIAEFDNGAYHNNKSSSFQISQFKGYFNRELLELELEVKNFDDPFIHFQSNGVVPMEAIYGFMGSDRITDGNGEIEIRNLKLDGRFEDMINTSRISRVNAGGQLEFDDASLTVNDETVTIDRGVMALEDNTLNIGEFKLEGAGSEIEFRGSAFNFIPVLFSSEKRRQSAELEFQAELKAKSLDIDRLLKLTDLGTASEEEIEQAEPEKVDSVKIAQIQKREKITSFLKGKFDANIDAFNYGKIEGTEFVGQLAFDNNEMTIEGKTKAMEGVFDLDGKMFFQDQPYLKTKLSCTEINVSEFFRQTENFGQEVLTSENIDGKLNAKILIEAFWDEKGVFKDDKLRVLAGVGIAEGKLQDFKMMESFSTFVNIKDLQDIQFTDMQNFLEVRKRRLYIPAMFIQSNALNMTISGEHTFDQEIQYNIKVNAGQVVVNRFKRHDPSLSPKRARRKGWFNLYYAILGTIEDFNIKSAKSRVKSDFELSDFRRKKIQEELEKEFGYIALVEEPKEWKEIPEYDGDADPDKAEYLDWDDQ
ncbi:MAG: AsmA family protein [Saprospiraceae bacterium]|nr:AsmA family protein [Saprospiraceae bacterium]